MKAVLPTFVGFFVILSASAAQAYQCPQGFTPNNQMFANSSDVCTRTTYITRPTPGYQVGDVLVGSLRIIPGLSQPVGIQMVMRNGVVVGFETYVEDIQVNFTPTPPANQSTTFQGATTYVNPNGGAYNPQTGQAIHEVPCYQDPDQDKCQ